MPKPKPNKNDYNKNVIRLSDFFASQPTQPTIQPQSQLITPKSLPPEPVVQPKPQPKPREPIIPNRTERKPVPTPEGDVTLEGKVNCSLRREIVPVSYCLEHCIATCVDTDQVTKAQQPPKN
jgi:hypothetical protein